MSGNFIFKFFKKLIIKESELLFLMFCQTLWEIYNTYLTNIFCRIEICSRSAKNKFRVCCFMLLIISTFTPFYFISFECFLIKPSMLFFSFFFWGYFSKSNLLAMKLDREYFLKNQIYKGSLEIIYESANKKF